MSGAIKRSPSPVWPRSPPQPATADGLLGCAGPPAETSDSGPCPSWFANPPEDPSYIFAATTTTSRDLQTAVNKAKTQARGEMATQMEIQIQRLTELFNEEIGLDEDSNFYAFSPDVTFGSLIQVKPNNYTFVDITDGSYSSFTITFRDQVNQPDTIQDSNIVIMLAVE